MERNLFSAHNQTLRSYSVAYIFRLQSRHHQLLFIDCWSSFAINRCRWNWSCCDRKYRAARAQSFAPWQEATTEITRRDHSIIACSRHTHVFLFFAHIPFVVNHTINATPPERLQQSYDKDCILGLLDLLCHITKNPKPNCKPVSNFQNLLKKCCSLHQNISHKKSCLHQPSLNNNAESPNDDHLHSGNSLWTTFIVVSATNLML